MKERHLGIDVGTNSFGWGIVDYDETAFSDKYSLVLAGSNIFEEGVKIDDKSKAESSRAAERTAFKHMRLGYWRRKIRKIALLKALRDNNLCPHLTDEELRGWRTYKRYPMNPEFMTWLGTDEESLKNPYYYRNLCLEETLDMTSAADRHKLGRALYHINQRRGFLNNRKENTEESDNTKKSKNTKRSDNKISDSINSIDRAMEESGYEYLGQYFYALYEKGIKIRGHYTHRLNHYEKELLAICRKQGLDEELTARLRRIIITQRPLKSQKHAVGHCVFEKKKTRCPASHPLFEQFRMYSFINNIRMQGPGDDSLRSLTSEEKNKIIPLFLRKTKINFKFEDIAKALSVGKDNYCHYKSREPKAYRFNYYMDATVSGCPVCAQLADVFDADKTVDGWWENASETYLAGPGKTKLQIIDDIWHALFFFDDEDKLKQFAIDKLQLSEEKALKFAKIKMPSDYGRLSLKAIRKILPYMKYYGMSYAHSVFLANVTSIKGVPVSEDFMLPALPREDVERFIESMGRYDGPVKSEMTLEEYVKQYIVREYNLPDEYYKELDDILYHPSMVETFPDVTRPTPKGYFQLGSPRTDSVRNPMAMRSLFRLRHVVNTLLAKGLIDRDTTVHIELSRELNDANRRAGIRKWQLENEGSRKKAIDAIKEHKGNNYVPSEEEILKYILCKEQNDVCLYTGEKIDIDDLFDGTKFDIEHTVPRSRGGDSTQANLTLCQSRFNRNDKGAKLPSELPNHSDILARIQPWEEKLQDIESQIRGISAEIKRSSDVDTKNQKIQERHTLSLKRDYWREKINRFKMTEVPEGFARRQGVDVGVISRYALAYLKSVFKKVRIVNGVATAEFRKIWGLQEEFEKKSRVNHSHHAIDAVTIACIGPYEYARLAQYYRDEERFRWGLASKRATFEKPWSTFSDDMKKLSDTLVVCHYTRDNVGKPTRKRIKGTKDYAQGDTSRVSLHKDTIYGAIEREGKIKYVVRKVLADIDKKDVANTVKNIVDHEVRKKVYEAIDKYGSLAKAVEAGIWMNEEKGIRINKVRCYATTITKPIPLRKQRDVSRFEHKRSQFVANDSNYEMGIYVQTTAKGKEKRDFILVNNLTAVRQSMHASKKNILPETSPDGGRLRWTLRDGTMVLFYHKSPDEIYNGTKEEIVRRLYKVVGLSTSVSSGYPYGRIVLRHCQEARPAGQIKTESGEYVSGEELRPGIKMYHTQFNALVEGIDFKMDQDGEIHWLKV